DRSKNGRRTGEDAAQRAAGVADTAKVEGDGGGGGLDHGPRSYRREDDGRRRGKARIQGLLCAGGRRGFQVCVVYLGERRDCPRDAECETDPEERRYRIHRYRGEAGRVFWRFGHNGADRRGQRADAQAAPGDAGISRTTWIARTRIRGRRK